ncbi:MAG: tRNA preQ1(34) S-adenosylmethionine ribosyltransferase-isomerase QueA, partial [Elusimicrobiota bacterium]|nr:tRNA preQ1(34) S-adenosylmethionine ribosyltransferase-isomerase QueA [Elusimicrobiota bacterium]
LITNLFSADTGNHFSPYIRVAIVTEAQSLSLKTSSEIYVYDLKSKQRYRLLADSVYEITSRPREIIRVAGQDLSSPIKLVSPDGEERIKIGGHTYRGEIILHSGDEENLTIVENILLEHYIGGVLSFEMSPKWPLEALKAQAVASRTFAIKNLQPDKLFDITAGVERQVYKGHQHVNPRIIEAVNSTRGEILTYKGIPFKTYFHSCCGGHTANNRIAWHETAVKPLKGVRDPYCKNSKHYRWSLYLSKSDLLAFVQKQGSTALRIRGMRVSKKSRSRRAINIKFTTNGKSFTAKAYDMRKYFGSTEFRSTYITKIRKKKYGYKIYGRGWGHGVGMCQEGAKSLAHRGRSYRQILRHYYPHAKLLNMANSQISSAKESLPNTLKNMKENIYKTNNASTDISLAKFDELKIKDLIASSPANPRDSSKLMFLNRKKKDMRHLRFNEIFSLIGANDCIVLNKSKVRRAKFKGVKSTGGKCEILLVKPLDEKFKVWNVLARKIPERARITINGNNTAVCRKRETDGSYTLEFEFPLTDDYLETYGEVPLPNYIVHARKTMKKAQERREDAENYQTVYAEEFGSIAAPTAGFHFTDEIINKIKANGTTLLYVTLHIGWGTFKPVRSKNPEEHIMMEEECSIDSETAQIINKAKKSGKRIIAVGTSSMRTLETFADKDNLVLSGRKNAGLFIYPGYNFRIANAFITNFHVPDSAPLYMTTAFAG